MRNTITLYLILAIAFSIYNIPQNTIAPDIQDWNLQGLFEFRYS